VGVNIYESRGYERTIRVYFPLGKFGQPADADHLVPSDANVSGHRSSSGTVHHCSALNDEVKH
jgi:hypothetical protein